jgi:hypothetical protein
VLVGDGSSVVVVVVDVFIGEDPPYIGEGATPELVIPLSHSHNVTLVSTFGCMSLIPTTTVPFNGARVPVEFVLITAIVIPFPSPAVAGLNFAIS